MLAPRWFVSFDRKNFEWNIYFVQNASLQQIIGESYKIFAAVMADGLQ